MTELNDLEKRIITLSYKHKLGHIGSCLTAVNIIWSVYQMMQDDDIFILSSGHAGVALYTVLEAIGKADAEELLTRHGVHPNTDPVYGITISTGSLGNGLPIAVGLALAHPTKTIYCLTSDGEWSEGSMWEAARVAAEYRISNLVILVNANGYSAMREVDKDRLEWQLRAMVMNGCPKVSFIRTDMKKYPAYLQGLEAHYHILTGAEYNQLI